MRAAWPKMVPMGHRQGGPPAERTITLSNRQRISRRSGRALQPQGREEERELVGVVTGQILGRQVLEDVDPVPPEQQLVHRKLERSDWGFGTTSVDQVSDPISTTSRSTRNCAAANPMPGELVTNFVLSADQ